jgi:hypothetical protein
MVRTRLSDGHGKQFHAAADYRRSSLEDRGRVDVMTEAQASHLGLRTAVEAPGFVVRPNYQHLFAGSGEWCVAIHNDGSLVFWGNVRFGNDQLPAGNDFIAVAPAVSGCAALRSDGTVESWGGGYWDGQVRSFVTPGGLSNIVAITGYRNTLAAVASDGTVTMWGETPDIALPDSPGTVLNSSHGSGVYLDADGHPQVWGPTGYPNYAPPTYACHLFKTYISHGMVINENGDAIELGTFDNSPDPQVDFNPADLLGVRSISVSASGRYVIKSDGTIAGSYFEGYDLEPPAITGNFLETFNGNYNHYFLRDDGKVFGGPGSTYDDVHIVPSSLTLLGF